MPKIELLHIDCMEYMAALADKSFHIGIVDPPYGLKEHGGKKREGPQSKLKGLNQANYPNKGWDNSVPPDEYFDLLKQKTDNQIIFGANYFDYLQPKFIAPRRCDYNSFIEMHPNNWIIWDKKGNDNSDFSDCELAWTSIKSPTRIFKYPWIGFGYLNNKQKEKKIHPTQKPIQLYKWVLENYVKYKTHWVLDTHGGGRSLAIACNELGFNHVSCEIDADYHNSSLRRFNETISKLKLFV